MRVRGEEKQREMKPGGGSGGILNPYKERGGRGRGAAGPVFGVIFPSRRGGASGPDEKNFPFIKKYGDPFGTAVFFYG